MIDITLPNNGWTPRHHQMPLWRYLRGGGKRAMAVWHRRAGKDDVCLHHTAISAIERQGNYWHMLPEYAQARKAIWDAVNPHTGKRRIDEAFPAEMRASTRDTDMHIRLVNGSTWSCIGSDEYDRTVGSSAAGVVFSEYALSNPSAWGYLRPMLEENGGWATFITTPRGRNHAHAMYAYAAQTPGWFAERLTVEDTNALTRAQLDETLREYQALYGADFGKAQFAQEYYCDWQASILGAFLALECAQVRDEGRILPIEPLPDQLVHRAWDLGVTDDTSIWWFCSVGAQLFVLDHYSSSGVGLEHYVNEIEKREREHGWKRGIDYVPHDAKVKEWGSGRTRVETMQLLGLRPQLVPMASIEDGRNAARRTLALSVFHPRTEELGFNALEQNRREWDDEKKAFKATQVHDWTSHPADAFRYLALSWKLAPLREVKVEKPTGIMIPPPRESNRKGIRL
jgi:hypothetical protein